MECYINVSSIRNNTRTDTKNQQFSGYRHVCLCFQWQAKSIILSIETLLKYKEEYTASRGKTNIDMWELQFDFYSLMAQYLTLRGISEDNIKILKEADRCFATACEIGLPLYCGAEDSHLSGAHTFTVIQEKHRRMRVNLILNRIDVARKLYAEADDLQNIDGHLKGGIPSVDIESLSTYWQSFPKLQSTLFTPLRDGFYSLAVEKDTVRDTVYSDMDFSAYADIVERAFEHWKNGVDGKLRNIDCTVKPKLMIAEIAQLILIEYEPVSLIDKYDAYEVLLSYWNDVMSDDIYMIVEDGYKNIRDIEVFTKTTTKKKKDGTEETKTSETGWEGKLVPKSLVIEMFFSAEQKLIDDTETVISVAQAELDEMIENAEDDSVINEILSDKGALSKDKLKKELKERRGIDDEDTAILLDISDKVTLIDEKNKLLKELKTALDKKTREHYPKLTDDQCMELLLERKWYRSLVKGIFALYTSVCHCITERNTELVERYETTLPQLEEQVDNYEVKVKAHLERMGFEW